MEKRNEDLQNEMRNCCKEFKDMANKIDIDEIEHEIRHTRCEACNGLIIGYLESECRGLDSDIV